MTAQEHIERIRAALEVYNEGSCVDALWASSDDLVDVVSSPEAMSSVLAHIDAQQAEIEKLQSAFTLYDTAIDGQESEIAGLKAEIEYLKRGEYI